MTKTTKMSIRHRKTKSCSLNCVQRSTSCLVAAKTWKSMSVLMFRKLSSLSATLRFRDLPLLLWQTDSGHPSTSSRSSQPCHSLQARSSPRCTSQAPCMDSTRQETIIMKCRRTEKTRILTRTSCSKRNHRIKPLWETLRWIHLGSERCSPTD